ncbi:MAG: acetyl-CoA carboxylase carboxyl transferase subunit beta, partial [Firmicutes bacterium]|nr:acetyl-CoA carboxylase carboxyl transferase subunit beta [Bacillota bacterium]
MTVRPQEEPERKEFPDNLWTRCDCCGKMIFNKELDKEAFLCPSCGHHFRITARKRLAMLTEP